MKVLLINPFIKGRIVYGCLAPFSPSLPPLGLCYLASFLEKNGYSVKILDLNILSNINIINSINLFDPDIVGVTSTTAAFNSAKKLLQTIKSSFPGKITVLGGPHISVLPSETMAECPDIDIGVIGEGEITFCELSNAISNKHDLGLCKGIIFRKNNTTVRTDSMPLIDNLDTLPLPARHLLSNFNKYHHHFLRGGRKTSSIITSRGCPYACTFCDQTVFGRKVRGHSPDYICEEIKMLKRDFNIDFISFEDDSFNYSSKRLRIICQEIIKENLNISWGCSMRIDTIDKEDVQLMKRAGCDRIYIGIETLNNRIRKLMNKQMEDSLLMEKIKIVRNFDIKINASFMIGLPSETKKEIAETIDRAIRLPVDGEIFCLYTPYPGTQLRKLAKENGVVSSDWNAYSNHLSTNAFHPNSIDVKTLNKLLFSAYKKFYFSFKFLRKNYYNTHIFKQLIKYLFRKNLRAYINLRKR
ncbi:MAG: radical SAM protein [Candidatus Kaelpia aquatica]|nr:radical SAM protein [Candidatus Kaelpia aquatica]